MRPPRRLSGTSSNRATLLRSPACRGSRTARPLGGVLDAIYRETDPRVLYPVLCAYLHEIPVAQLEQAFDLCIDHEGTQTPDPLVDFFLRNWAERDPLPCWKRTQALFHVVGFEYS